MPTYIFDDYYGDERPGVGTVVPTYLPVVGQWDWIGGTCASCTLQTNIDIPIDPTKAQNATWHSVTVSPDEPETTISINFTGTAVTAYCLLPPDLGPWITSYMNVSFMLDGNTVGKFERTATGEDWTYNYPVYSVSNLKNEEHMFVVQPRADVNTSYLVFDYFTYEFDGTTPSSSSSTTSSSSTLVTSPTSGTSFPQTQNPKLSVGAIVGGAVGGVVVLITAILAIWLILRSRRRKQRWPAQDEPKEYIDALSYPQTTPFFASAPQHVVDASPTASREPLFEEQVLHPRDHSAFSTDRPASELLSSAADWPKSAEGKRALADASMQRMAEMEARVAQSPDADEENARLRREIDALQAQVEQLHVALEQQAAEIREGALYDLGEAPPSYEERVRDPGEAL